MRALRLVIAPLIALAGPAAAVPLSASVEARPAMVATHGDQGTPGAVVVVGVPALRWADLSPATTPALWQLAERGAVGSLSVRAAGSVTTPGDGWVTFGAGNRATARPFLDAAVEFPTQPGPGGDPGVATVVRRNDRLQYDARVGALGAALQAAAVPRVAFGTRAALGLATPAGEVPAVHQLPVLEAELPPALQRNAVVAVDLPQLADGTTSDALSAVDRDVASVVAVLRPQDTLLLAGLSDRFGEPPHLRVAIALGPAYKGGLLRSALTRRDGFVQLIDAGPTVLELKGVPRPAGMVGQPWRRVGGRAATTAGQIERLVDADAAAQGYRRYVPPFFLLLVLAQILLYGSAWWALRRRPTASGRERIIAVTREAALAFAAVPAATYLAQLVPWWRHSLGFLVAVVIGIDLALYAVAVAGPWRRRPFGPAGAVAAMTFIVIAVDLLTGARLQLSSLAGYSPIVAGRFAGIGNVAFAVFATGALLGAAALCVGRSRRWQLAIVAIVGTVAVVLDGAPMWGSDFGGVLALIPGFAALGLLVTGSRLSWRRAAVVGVAAVGVVAAFALLDYTRPASQQSHLGRFVGQLLHGGAGPIIERKARANLRLLTHSVLTLVVPIAVAFVTFVLLKPMGGLRRAFDRIPPLRAGLLSVLVMGVVGFLVNDSGVAVPALALTVAVPIALSVSLSPAAREPAADDGG